MLFIVQWYGNNRSEWSQHSLLNMDAYLISLNGNFNLFLSMSCCRQYDESLFCEAYLHDLGCVFSMIELNTHDWVAFPLRICIFSNTTIARVLPSQCQPYCINILLKHVFFRKSYYLWIWSIRKLDFHIATQCA